MDVEPASSSPIVANGTPSDTPRQNSLFSASHKSSGRATPSSFAPSTPPALPTEDGTQKHDDPHDDGPPLDPRRLTPNLHANLVSEILALRREVESKDTLIDNLEGDLASSKALNEELQEDLARTSKETKTVKLQLQSIEDGTLTALEDLCKERDEAREAAADLKKRLEISHRQLRAENDKNDRIHKEWESDKLRWIQEKGLIQRKCDITESRLKTVLEELVAQDAQNERPDFAPDNSEKMTDATPITDALASLHSSPVKFRSHHRNRSSVSTVGSARPESTAFGPNLADELDVNDEDTQSEADTLDDRTPRLSKDFDVKDVESQDWASKSILTPVQEMNEKDVVKSSSDQGSSIIQAPTASKPSDEADRIPASKSIRSLIDNFEIRPDINVSHNGQQAVPVVQAPERDQLVSAPELISASTQKFSDASASMIAQPLKTAATGNEPQSIREMSSISTQTDMTPDPEPSNTATLPPRTPEPLPIPEISIHPPQSGPPSPNEAALRAGTKHVAVQTDSTLFLNSRSVAVQTDIIRVDLRKYTLPPHLLPAALGPKSEQPSSVPDAAKVDSRGPSPTPTEGEPAKSIDSKAADPSSSSNGVEAEAEDPSWARLRRNLMFGTKYSKASDNDPFRGGEETGLNDGDYAAPIPTTRATRRSQKLGKPFDPPTPVPEDEKVIIPQATHNRAQASAGSRNSLDRSSVGARPNSFSASAKGKHVRQGSERSTTPTSMASSSAWSKSTGLPAGMVVPTRTSSIGSRQRRRDGDSSPPFRSGASSPTKGRDNRRVGKKPTLRKSRSASLAPSETQRGYPVSPYSQTSFASGETSPPPVPENSILQVYRAAAHQRSSSSQTRRLSSVYPTGNASVGSSIQHTVVDAIAAAMVGEWMWKYVRKRKTFGVSESAQESARTSDQRHKRWVWLSPYERTLMWSAKQPTTNSALLGKTGRKVTIQSVLDVKDETLSTQPQTSPAVFNRSILVLTPSRAIKFTASSRERHYLWLTALSFLAHHTSQGSLDLSFLPRHAFPQSPATELTPDVSRTTSATASRNGRKPWSSRTTNRSQQSSGYGTPSIPEATASAEGEGITVPPKPARPAPQAPSNTAAENFPSESALAPAVPRIPGGTLTSHNKNIFGIPMKHGRNRSASITGVMTINRSSTKVNQTTTSSTRSYPNTGATNSSNHSTKSGINLSAARRNNAAPPTPSINITNGSGTNVAAPPAVGSSFAKYLGGAISTQPQQPPTSPVLDSSSLTEPLGLIKGDSAPTLDWPITLNMSNDYEVKGAGESDFLGTDFGGNSRFFDAVGASLGAPANGLGAVPPPPKRAAPPPPASTAGAGGFRHVSGESFDSVAPPPIRGARPFAQRQGRDAPQDAYYGQSSSVGQGAIRNAEVSKPERPPSRKRSLFGFGK